VSEPDNAVDFFVSHADADTPWAEWIAAELESDGYRVIVQAWDFRPGENSLARLDESLASCQHAVCVLSPTYVDTEVAARTAALRQGLDGKERALIPVRVADCPVPASLKSIIAIDLFGVEDKTEARRLLLAGVADHADRLPRHGYPGTPAARVRFPGVPQEVWELRGRRPDQFFTGRDDELVALHRALRADRPTAAIQVITGLGGIGKSRLAVEYAYRYSAAYDLVWLIRAEDPATLHSDYAELAQALGLPSDKDDQAVASLRQELRRRQNWLLVFDNAEEPDDIYRLLPDRHPGHVLITTRRQEWPHAETRRLGVLPVPSAVEYLQRRGKVADAAIAAELADALGRLPLMLAQAGSVIADGMPASDYLGLLREQAPELFAEGRTGDGHVTIASTWRVSLERLADRSPSAVALFQFASFLNADAIPLARLHASTGMPAELADALTSPFQLTKATRALSEYSLAETGDGLLSVHRMVQAVTRAELGEDEPFWCKVALTTTSAAFPLDVDNPKAWDACEALLPHALTCAEHAIRLNADATATVELLNRTAEYLLARGRIDLADPVISQALGVVEALNHDDLVVLSCRNTYGKVLLARGDLPAARTAQEGVYKARTDILGPRDPGTLRAGRDLVEVLYRQGYLIDARRLQDGLVDAFTSVLGEDDLETITARAYQATLMREAGQYARARAIEEQVIAVRSRVLGPEHPHTLNARGNLAATLAELGQLASARTIYEQLAEDAGRVLGAEHPYTLYARGNLAATLRELGQPANARAIYEQLIEATTRLLGPEHPTTLNARGSLALTLRELGQLANARAIYEQLIEATTRLLGPENPTTLNVRGSLAATLAELGRLANARTLYEQLVVDCGRVLGPLHLGTLTARGSLAATQCELGQLANACASYERLVEDSSRALGPEHPTTLRSLGSLAGTLRELGQPDVARTTLEQLVEDYSRVLGPEHPATLTARNELATTLRELGQLDDARAGYEQLGEDCDRILGPRHPTTLRIKGNLATTLSELGQLDVARTIQEEAAAIAEQTLGDEHRYTLNIKANLAATMSDQGDKSEAGTLLAKCLAISRRVFGIEHNVTSSIAWQLAENCGPYEQNKRRIIIIQNLGWLVNRPSDQLTAEQKRIKNAIKTSRQGKLRRDRKRNRKPRRSHR
jgi:tetratricopeptide (TPR) repeat protein